MVSAAAVHFEETCHYFRNCHVTGVPVRREFFNVPPRPKDARPTLLVFGGSQGAHAINQAVLEALPQLMEAVPGDPHHSSDGRKRLRGSAGGLSASHGLGGGVTVHRRHAGSVCARRFAALPLRRQHRCRDHCGGEASDLRSSADCGRRPSDATMRPRWPTGGRGALVAASGAHGRAAGDGDCVACCATGRCWQRCREAARGFAHPDAAAGDCCSGRPRLAGVPEPATR